MKKAFMLVCVLILMASLTIGVSALRVGDEIGDVRNTDIRTYVNGHRIPSFNINNRSVVMLRDLVHYGFDTTFNEVTRTATLIRNYDKPFNPILDFEATMGPPGSLAFRHLHTDITAVINGVTVQSFNVRGYTAILFADLRDVGNFGTMRWEESTRRSSITLFDSPVRGVSVDRPTLSVRAGDTFQIGAIITPADANNRAVTWSSSNTNIATVNSNGVITGVNPGTAIITVTTAHGGHTATSTVTVTPRQVHVNTVTLHASSASIRTGEHFTFNATITPADATERTLTWTTSNANVATVDSQGRVTAVGAGTATITVTSQNGRTATATVTVTYARPVTSITLDRATVTLSTGNTTDMVPTILPHNANNRTVTWTTSNANVATVNANGRITAVSAGTATITAKASSGHTASVVVTVGGASDFAFNREYGPFTLTATGLILGGGTHTLTINSFVFTNQTAWGFPDSYRIEMRIRGTSSDDAGGHFHVAFRDVNNALIETRTIWIQMSGVGRTFDFSTIENISRSTISRTVRVEFTSATGQLAVPGPGQQAGGYRPGENYSRFPTVPSFGRVAEHTLANQVFATRQVISSTTEVYTYNLAAHTSTAIDNIMQNYRWALATRGFAQNMLGIDTFVREGITVQMWRAGSTITITVQQTS